MSPARLPELAVVGRRLCEPLTGVGRYLECLLRWWGRTGVPFERIRVYVPGEPSLPADALRGAEVVIVPGGASPLAWENWTLVRRLSGRELLFGAYTLPWFSAARGVVSNLGIYEGRPGDFPLSARIRTTPFFRHAARAARRVIANSTSTKNDVIAHYGAPASKIDVIWLGADEALAPGGHGPSPPPEDVRARHRLPACPYFLLVGKLSKRRNIPLLIEAFAAAARGGAIEEALVLVGPDHWGVGPEKLASRAGISGKVVWTPHAPMEDLAHLYRGATAFVLPTEHEGFSLTIPEAMACGAPAVVFDHTALEGGLREAVLLVEPRTKEGLAEALRAVAVDAGLRGRLRERSLACAAQFRWERTARETMGVLAAAAGLLDGSGANR